MKKEFAVSTSRRQEFICIDHIVHKAVKESGIENGICTVFTPHTTSGITINEHADPDVVRDIIMELDKIVPLNDNYAHMEGNSAAHIKSSLMGPSLQVIIENGSVCLGTWQGIYFCEFDGPRNRKVWISVIPG